MPVPPEPEPAASLGPEPSTGGMQRWGLGIGVGLGLIVMMVTAFVVGRNIAAKWGGDALPDSTGNNPNGSGQVHATDRATIDHVIVTAFPEPGLPGGSYWFTFWVSTVDPTRNIQFTAWTADVSKIPPMTDDLGNRYNAFLPLANPNDPATQLFATDLPLRIRANRRLEAESRSLFSSLPAGLASGSGSVTSQSARGDLIAYQPVVPAAKKLYIALPAANVGSAGNLNFEFHIDKLNRMFGITP